MPLEVNWPFPNFKRSHRLWNICSAVVIPIVGATSKIWLSWLNKVRVHNFKSLIHEIENRPEGQPLVTICNHHSCYDDPGLWGLLHWRILFRSNIIRWSGAASDVIFLNNFLAKFFAMGQTVPIVRGDGVYERSIEFLIQRLNEGKWVHFFPEGRVNLEKKKFLRLKWGIGRMISDCDIPPTILPFWHIGMDDVLPNKRPYIPRVGQKVTVLYGEPFNLAEMLEKLKQQKVSAVQRRKIITDYLQDKMMILKEEAEKLHDESV